MLFQASLFNESVLKIEGDETSAIETNRYIRDLEARLKRRRDDNFLSTRADNAKNELIDAGIGRSELEGQCKQFFGKITITTIFLEFVILFVILIIM